MRITSVTATGTMAALFLLLFACGPAATTPAPAAPAPAGKVEQKPAPASDWESLVAAARNEGKVAIYTVAPDKVRTALAAAVKKKFAIDLEFVAGTGGEVVPKIERERAAGLYLVDITMLGWTSYVNMIRPLQISVPIEPLLVLPEVKDTSKWFRGRLPVMDEAGYAYALTLYAPTQNIFNTDMVKQGEISGVRDFLNPKWKGKIGLFDPTFPGPAIDWYGAVTGSILGLDAGRAFMKELAPGIAAVTRDYRQVPEWVARGKYAIGIGARADECLALMKEGAPIAFVDTSEPRVVNPTWSAFQVIKDRPHPNATRVLVNWLLTQEGSSAVGETAQLPTTRADVSTAGINPVVRPRPTDILASEKYQAGVPELIRMAKEDFAVLFK
ncbi:MAG: extracellular solute-binding protein [Chloroflexi bacterium]|nr:extracellular solute-binding protein [Chloroflexota bacterium]